MSQLYLDRARALKKIGALPSHYRTSKTTEYSQSEKRHLRRLWERHGEIADAPDKFFIRSVSKKTSDLARQSGVATYKSTTSKKAKIYVPKGSYEELTIEKNIITLGLKEKYAYKNRKILLTPRRKILDRIKYLMDTRKLRKYEFLQIRIGNNAPFSTVYTYESFLNYITVWQPKDEKWKNKREELLTQLSIVSINIYPKDMGKVKADDPRFIEQDESYKRKNKKRRKQKNSSNRFRNRPI